MMATGGGCAFGVGHNAERCGNTPGRAGPGLDMVQPGPPTGKPNLDKWRSVKGASLP